MIIGLLWEYVVMRPMLNGLIILANLLFGNFGLAIIAFTVIVRMATFPLTLRQLRSTRAVQALQPKIQEVQKKYKDPRRRSEETMKLYREAGVNPLGCVFPMLVQFPIWIALYQSIITTLSHIPENLVNLSQRLYPLPYIYESIPLDNTFLWLDLSRPDPTLILAVLVFASTWVQQRMMTPASTDPKQQAQTNMMLWMMPLLFAWFTLTFPSGLALYWVASNLIGIVLNYFAYGGKGINWRQVLLPVPAATPQGRPAAPRPQEQPAEAKPAANPTTARRRRKRASYGRARSKR